MNVVNGGAHADNSPTAAVSRSSAHCGASLALLRLFRNLLMDLDDAGRQVNYLIRDRDGKYPVLIDAILADAGITVVLSGVRMPRMNSVVERWIQSCRYELLDRTCW